MWKLWVSQPQGRDCATDAGGDSNMEPKRRHCACARLHREEADSGERERESYTRKKSAKDKGLDSVLFFSNRVARVVYFYPDL